MTRLLVGLVLALAYIGGTTFMSGATAPRATHAASPTTDFRDCIVEVSGKYVGVRLHGMDALSATAPRFNWSPDSAAGQARCSLAPAESQVMSKQAAEDGQPN